MVNEVIVFPPLAAAKLSETAVELDTVAPDINGVSGTVVEVALATDDAAPVPTAFIADTR